MWLRILVVVVVVVVACAPGTHSMGTPSETVDAAQDAAVNALPTDVCTPTPPTTYVDPAGQHSIVIVQQPTLYPLCGDPRPLLLVLGSYGSATGFSSQIAMGWRYLKNVPPNGAIIIAPDGLLQPGTTGTHYWNSDPGCCDKLGVGNDDGAYLRGLLRWTLANYNIDRSRVFVAGVSNGGFMAERVRCDDPDLVTAIVDWAGAGQGPTAAACTPGLPVAALVDHSFADTGIVYPGGHFHSMPQNYLGTLATIDQNATQAGCSGLALAQPNAYDHDSTVAGAETDRLTMTCSGAAVEHWREPTSVHGFTQTTNGTPDGPITTLWGDHAWAWLMEHPR